MNKNNIDLSVTLANIKLDNPLMLASGILGQTGDALVRVINAGAGAVVTKSIGLYPNPGHPGPNLIEVSCGLINSMGLPNPGIDEFLREIELFKTKTNKPIIVSIYGSSEEEFAEIAEKLKRLKINAIELNVSCPHSKENILSIGLSPKLVGRVVSTVRDAVSEIPLFLKLPGNTNIEKQIAVAKAAVKTGIDAIVAINTLPAIAIDVWTQQPVLGFKIGGLSGPAIKPVAVRIVYDLFKNIKTPIIGVGGITKWEDAIEFFLAGATAVQIGSGIAFEDLQIFVKIKEGILKYLKRKQVKSVTSLIGKAHGY